MIWCYCPRCAIVRPVILVQHNGQPWRSCTHCGAEWQGTPRPPEPEVPAAFLRAFAPKDNDA